MTIHPCTGRARRRSVASAAAVLTAITLAACSADSDDSAATVEQAAVETGADERSTVEPDGAGGALPTDEAATSPVAPGIDLGSIGRDVAIEMQLTVEVDDLRAAVRGVLQDAAAAGGGVAQSDVDYGDDSDEPDRWRGHARLVLKVPPASVEQVVAGLDRYGRVTSIGQAGEDVTDQLVDLEVQIANAERSVERVRELLDEATDLRTIVEIEADLTERQIRLERLLATQQALQDRVALATLTVELMPAPPTSAGAEPDDGDGLLDALATGWDAFVSVLFAGAFVVAVVAPFLAVAALLAVVAWVLARTRRAGSRAPEVSEPERDDDLVSASPRE